MTELASSTFFKIRPMRNCMTESVYMYHLNNLVTSDLLKEFFVFGDLKRPMTAKFPFYKLDGNGILITGNIDSKEISLTIKKNKLHAQDYKKMFEQIVVDFLIMERKDGNKSV